MSLFVIFRTSMSLLSYKGPVIIYRVGGSGGLRGGIRWLSEELRGGSAVIDRRKGGIRPKKWNFRSRQEGGEALCKYLVRVCRRDSIKTPTLGWGGIMTSSTTDKGGSLKN